MRKIVIGLVNVPRSEGTKNQMLKEIVEVELEKMLRQLLMEKGVIEKKAYLEDMFYIGNRPYPRGINKPCITAT